MLNLDDIVAKIRLDDSDVDQAAARTDAQLVRIGRSAQVGQRQFTELSRSTRLTRQEMLALNYTVSDVAASLASGASPFTILLQQGGQVRDTFGGIGPLFAKLGAAITIGGVAIAATAGAVGLLSYAFIQGTKDSDDFQKAIQRSGNAAGVTESQYRALADQVSQASGATVASSREVLQLLIATGRFGPEALKSVGVAAASMAKAFNISEAEAVKSLTGMADGVSKWAAEHNKSTNYITLAQYKYIKALEEQGKVQEAIAYNSKLVDEANKRVTKNLGYLETAWNGIKSAASSAINAMLGLGRVETTSDLLERAQKELTARQARGPLNDLTKASFEKGNERLKQEIYLLQEKERLERRSADAQSRSALANAAAIAEEEKKRGKTPKKPVDAFNEAQDQLEERLRVGFDRIADSEIEAIDKANRKRSEDYLRRTNQAAELGQQLLEQSTTISASLIRGEEERGQALLAIEKAQLSARIQAMELAPLERQMLEDQAAKYIAARERQLTEELKPEWQRRLDAWTDLQSEMRNRYDDFVKGFVDSGRSMFEEFAETGKVSTRGLVAFIRGEFARLFYDRFLAQSVSGFASGLFNLFTGAGGGGGDFGIGGGSGTPLVDLGLGAGRARGGDVKRGRLHPVNEEGTELLHQRGRTFIIPGADGRITAADKWAVASRGGGDIHLTLAPVFHGGVSRNDLMNGMAVAAEAAVSKVADLRRRGNPAFG